MLNLNLCNNQVTIKFGKTTPVKVALSEVKGMSVIDVISKYEEELGINADTISKIRAGSNGVFNDVDLNDEIGALTYLLYQSISDKG